jgi:hypothetical protein
MKMQKEVTLVLLLITVTFAFGQDKKKYQYHNNMPTKYGIQHYIDMNQSDVVNTVEKFIGDTIISYSIKVDNLSEYQRYDSLEAGRFYPEDQIVITNQLKFYDYELDLVPRWRQREFDLNTKFVKGVLIHEFIHLYIFQFIYECLENNIPVNSEYVNLNIFPRMESYYSSEFIEEGICEYVVMKLNEGIFRDYELDFTGEDNEKNVGRFMQEQDSYSIRYQYSRTYVQPIFEKYAFKKALLIILTSKPPTYEELLSPDQYYSRLMKHAQNL